LSSSATITDLGLRYLSSLELTTLSLGDCNQIQNDGISLLTCMISLTDLSLNRCRSISYAGYCALSVLTNLRTLRLEECGESNLEFLRHFLFLETLDLSRCLLLRKKVVPLGVLSNLIDLNLSGCKKLKNDGLVHLVCLTRLRSLNLSNCPKISSSTLLRLSVLTELRLLDVTDCKNVKVSSIKTTFYATNMFLSIRSNSNKNGL